MTSEAAVPPVPAPPVAELLTTLVKAMRAFKMYLPNNPIYQKAAQNVAGAFAPVWEHADELALKVTETDLLLDEVSVYHQASRSESFAWSLYKDGLRLLVMRRGIEQDEIVRFLEVVNRARFLPPDAGDDLLTLLWEVEFEHLAYRFADIEGAGDPTLGGAGTGTAWALEQGANHPEPQAGRAGGVRTEAEQPRPPGVVDPEDFDSTLYFLDDQEVAHIAREMEAEYARDVRESALAALLDIYEQQADDAVRTEVMAIVEGLFPSLLSNREFRAVAWVLRETRGLGQRAPQLTAEQRARLAQVVALLSDPAVLSQLVQAIDESTAATADADVVEVLRELQAGALETLVTWIPRVARPEVRALLEQSVDRLASQYPDDVLRLLRHGPPEAMVGLVSICGRLRLQGAVSGLADAVAHADPAVRLAAVEALGEIGSPGALQAIDRGIDDAERAVRLAAVRVAGARGFKGALRRIEPVILGKGGDRDLTERMAFFEAYGAIAGEAGIDTLRGLLLARGLFSARQPPEVRACAAMALGRVRGARAREVLQQAADDREAVVRTAVGKALRALGA